jgi:hypothetical protein
VKGGATFFKSIFGQMKEFICIFASQTDKTELLM